MKNIHIATALAAALAVLTGCNASNSTPTSGYAPILNETTATVAFSASVITGVSTAGTQGNVSFTLSEVGYSGNFKILPAENGCVNVYTTTPLPTPTNNVTGPTNQYNGGTGVIGAAFVASGATCVTTAGYTLPAVDTFTVSDTLGNTMTVTVTVNT